RIPEEFSFGPFQSARRDFVDVDTIERVEIARGPVSTLYGSDALGGVVAVTTRAPNDYVSADDPMHLDVKTGYSSEDDSVIGALNVAIGNDRVAGLLTYTRRAGSETETNGGVGGFGEARSQADPQDILTETIGGKFSFRVAERHNLVLALERFDSEVETNLLSDYGTLSRGTLVNTRDAEDVRERLRYSASWRYQGGEGLVQDATVSLYRQQSETEQFTFETRTSQGADQRRERNSIFDQEIEGLFAQGTSLFDIGFTEHSLTYGIDVYRTDNQNLREGGTTDVASGLPVREFLPLPTRDFPSTRVENRAFFLQDEIVLAGGRLRITPGLRYDDFSADVSADALYFEGNPGVVPPEDYDDDALTLKLGGLYQLTEDVAVWARYSEGFRAPPYDDVNVGFSNFIGGYKSIPAPNLEAETSEGFEIGLRTEGTWGRAQLAVFTTEYDNFIESNVPAPIFAASGGIDPADGLLTFQSVNRDGVTIEGIEARGQLALGALTPRLSSFFLEGAAAWAEGEGDGGRPVNTVDPLNTVVGLRWAPPRARYEGELVWTWADAKDEGDIDPTIPRIASDSFHLLDLLAHVRVTERVRLDVGVFNLFDEHYIRWADTAGIGMDAPDRFTRPGRNFSATLRASL
ncbi:MAG: TonB-dependent receptor, partial [Pseudomonadales bacterium]|nr:TonB-dependent receptor [Pseudomonadales bacterium]